MHKTTAIVNGTEVSIQSECNIVVHRAKGGWVIPLGDITVEAAPKNPIIKWLWIANIHAKLNFPWFYGCKREKEAR